MAGGSATTAAQLRDAAMAAAAGAAQKRTIYPGAYGSSRNNMRYHDAPATDDRKSLGSYYKDSPQRTTAPQHQQTLEEETSSSRRVTSGSTRPKVERRFRDNLSMLWGGGDGKVQSKRSEEPSSGYCVQPHVDELRKLFERRHPHISHFNLDKTIGTGSFGRVRLVRLKQGPSTPMALKIMKKSRVLEMKQVEHVRSEKQILDSISHPFIVNMLASFQDRYKLYMLMEYVSGGELFSHLRNRHKLPVTDARFYAAEIVLAFEYLHGLRVVYRDLKPENLLLDIRGHIKMTDFGFAKVVEDRTWTLCGTPEYLAPEIIQSRGHGKSVDWWALGILIYEMIVGAPPFYDEDPMKIYRQVVKGSVDYPPTMDPRAKDLIRKLLTQDRTKRYGCLKSGAEDVKTHKFFSSISWTDCYNRQLKAPFVPKISSPDDTSMFDDYPDSDGEDVRSFTEEEDACFANF